jgi:hypothetical protein
MSDIDPRQHWSDDVTVTRQVEVTIGCFRSETQQKLRETPLFSLFFALGCLILACLALLPH